MSEEFLSFKLSDDFVATYSETKPNWGFPIGAGNSLGEIVFFNNYSRIKEDGTKEHWHETCRRVIEGYYSILKDHCNYNRTPWNESKAVASAKEAYDRMFSFKWLPPGRGIWAMGTKAVNSERNAAMLYNCFRGDVQVITSEGIRNIKDLAGYSAKILTGTGKWVEAPFKSFGEQKLIKLTLQRQGIQKEIMTTTGHRWFARNLHWSSSIQEMTTTELQPGYRLAYSFGHGIKNNTTLSPIGIQYGFTFGDGTNIIGERNDNKTFIAKGKDEALLSYFINHKIVNRSDQQGWDVLGLPNVAKKMPDLHETKAFLGGWLAGYFAADGSIGEDGTNITISSCNIENLEIVKNVCAVLGLGYYDITQTNRISNLTGQSSILYKITLMGEQLTSAFFVHGKHRSRFENNLQRNKFDTRDPRNSWKVVSVEETEIVEEVFCAVVEKYGNFTLEGNILTGNCAVLTTAKITTHSAKTAVFPFVRLMEMSMNGIGVGFDTRGAGNLKIHAPLIGLDNIFTVPDTREGWAESLGVLLESYFFENRTQVTFDYSLIRPSGTPLKRFGGTASGPVPLVKMHEKISELLNADVDKEISSHNIVDIMNLAAKAVVAGGSRRSALLALGEPDDKEFINLKNYENYPERNGEDGWAHLSNNSIIAEVGGSYEHLIDLIADNGEPGILYLDMARNYGRTGDAPDGKDQNVIGCNPCAEIFLESSELCNLSELFPNHHVDIADFKRSLKHAYMYNKAVTLLPTPWPETNEVINRNRRIGLSVSGTIQFLESKSHPEYKQWLEEAYTEVLRRDNQYSAWLGIRESIRHTTSKPSGSVSILAGATPGVHWPTNSIYIRRMRMRPDSDIVKVLTDAGYKVEPDVMDPDNTVVVELPTMGPDVRTERDVTIWEKASVAALVQKHFADNAVSCTITFKDSEKNQIGAVLRTFEGQLKSISFLPLSDGETIYAQMPYEAISLAQYKESVDKTKPINWKKLYNSKKSDDAIGDKFCTSDTCEIKF